MSVISLYVNGAAAIRKGLSPVTRGIIAVLAVIIAIVCVISAPGAKAQLILYLIAAFCILVFMTCLLKDKARQFVGCFVALFILALAAWYPIIVAFELLEDKKGINFLPLVFSYLVGKPSILFLFDVQFGLKSTKNRQ